MFKLVAFLAIVAVCLAHPSVIAASPYVSYSGPPVATVAYHQHALATVGAVVKNVPTSVSHTSHAVVHKSDQVVQDVVTPVVKTTYTAPISYSNYPNVPVSYAPYAVASPFVYGV